MAAPPLAPAACEQFTKLGMHYVAQSGGVGLQGIQHATQKLSHVGHPARQQSVQFRRVRRAACGTASDTQAVHKPGGAAQAEIYHPNANSVQDHRPGGTQADAERQRQRDKHAQSR